MFAPNWSDASKQIVENDKYVKLAWSLEFGIRVRRVARVRVGLGLGQG